MIPYARGDFASRFYIRSESENGYWCNRLGWVFDPESATHFTLAERNIFSLPMTAGDDAEWVEMPHCTRLTCRLSCRNDVDGRTTFAGCRG